MATEVASGVVQQRIAHTKVVYVDDANLLLDTGVADEWDAVSDFVEAQGAVDRLFLSHHHGDHVGNAERVIDAHDPDVFVPAEEPLDVDFGDAAVTEVGDGDEIVSGITAVSVPGHTPGISGLYLEDSAILLASDILDGADRRGLPAGYLLPPPAAYNWDSEQAEVGLDRLRDFDIETAVVTHGSNVDSEVNAQLDRFLDFQDHYRQDLLASLE
jgi:glyoxylase-like metal-dependent hydrolase (beta-lactamase superfamily II)